MPGLPWRGGPETTPHHNPNYENRLDRVLRPPKDPWRSVHAGRELLGLLGGGLDYLDFESYYLAGALTAANNVVLNDSFYPGVDQSMPTEQAIEARQRTVDTLQRHLHKSFSSDAESPSATLRWAAAYVTLTGQECWDEADAEALRTEIAPRIRRHIDAGDDNNLRILARLAPRYRLVFEHDLWRNWGERNRVITANMQDVHAKVQADTRKPGVFAPLYPPSYGWLLAADRLLRAAEIRRIPDNLSRGIDIIDPA